MYLAGVSVRRVEDITEALWGTKVSPGTISNLNKKAYEHIETWRNWPLIGGNDPFVYVDGIFLKPAWGGEYENVAILIAIGINEDGHREILGVFPEAKYQRCTVHFYRNVFSVTPRSKMNQVTKMLKSIHASEDNAAVKMITEFSHTRIYHKWIFNFYNNIKILKTLEYKHL